MPLLQYSFLLSFYFFVSQEENLLSRSVWGTSVNAQQEIIVYCVQRGSFLYSYSRPFVIMNPDKRFWEAEAQRYNERHVNKEIK